MQYVGGTVKSIPVNSAGSFNFDDPKELRFHYSGTVYRIPYDQITTTEIEKADVKHVMHVIPAQSLMFTHRKRTLVINYTDATGATGTLNFELAAYRAADAQETIAAKKTPPPAGIVEAPWWGDKIWKTARNKAAWDAQAALNAQAAQAAHRTPKTLPWPSPASCHPAARSSNESPGNLRQLSAATAHLCREHIGPTPVFARRMLVC